MGRKISSGDLELFGTTAATITTMEIAGYVHGMLDGIYRMTARPDAKTLRSIVWLAKMEARRMLEAEKTAAANGERRRPARALNLPAG
jgi:hypothetical protein